MRLAKLLCLLALLLPTSAALAQTGKIAGRVTDGGTGEPLPGVAVTIEGTTQGALSDIDGYYTILNVRPGTYSLKAAFIGYTPAIKENVRVNIDLTATVDFQLSEGTVGLSEVVVQAERPVVQRDVSASVANINQEQIENLPVASVAEVIGLQAGFEPGLTVRGSGGSQVAFAVDGVAFTDPRTNNPNTEISYTSIDEVQVQTGGFNAEYGNVRSGLINVVTKDPARDRYTADILLRYSGASQQNFTDFGTGYGDVEHSYWAYPRLSTDKFPGDANGDGTIADGEMCEVSLCGVSVLPEYLRKQYEQFGGWNSLASGGITPEQLRKGEEWLYRKDFTIKDPDYEVDGTITGPIPVIGPMLGNLRFSASFRQTQQPYVIPGQRSSEKRRTFQGKLVSDIGKGMKLAVTGIHGLTEGVAFTGEGIGYRNVWAGLPGYPWYNADNLESNLVGVSVESEVFGDYFYSPHDHTNSVYGVDFTHTLSPKTFYEVQLQRTGSSDLTVAPVHRIEDAAGNSLVVRCVTPDLKLREANECQADEVSLTEAPFGYKEKYEYYGGQAFGSQRGDARDTSSVSRWNARFDITSQLNRFMEVKAGAQYISSDYDILYGSWDPANPHQENERFRWQRSPAQGALYAQTKLEFKGMIANLGLRADYFHAGGDWYDYDAFSRIFTSTFGYDALDDTSVVDLTATERHLTLSPRLGVSFPVTEDSKFYFNYGHFRQMPDPAQLFEIRYGAYTTQIQRMGNPNIPLPKTVAYEVGFEQSFADLFLVRLAGFYRDLSEQGRDVNYVSIDGLVNYTRQEPLSYGDNRGFEITVAKDRGDWLRGFVNYTYLSTKSGGFGWGTIFQDLRQYRQYVSNPNNLQQNARVPEPFARMNVELRLPNEFGPTVAGAHLLGDWRIALLGEWRSGAPSTWDGNNFTIRGPGSNRKIAYNTKWKDFWNFDMRLSKNFATGIGRAQFYVDVTNVFNLRQMYYRRGSIFLGENDTRDYIRSLHLPAASELFKGVENYTPGYDWVPGDDRPGDYRKPGVAFDPIYAVQDVASVSAPIDGALYYDLSQGKYVTPANGSWTDADAGRVKQVLDDRAYIDMPNGSVMAFLNPRDVFFGIRLSF